MMKYSPFSMFDVFENPDIQTLVNTINCVGIMGKGLALECRIRYPEMFEDYRKRCEKNKVKIGVPYLYIMPNKWILNFPTKYHWKYPAKIEYIEKGLKYFKEHYREWGIKTIAFPRLGSSEGKLNWEKQVKLLMEKYLGNLNGIEVYIYLDQEPSQRERKILRLLNTAGEEDIKEQFNLNKKQIESIKDYIRENGNLNRIRELLKIRRIGEKTYQKVIKLEFSKNPNMQQKLF